jgi:hypothetical protein
MMSLVSVLGCGTWCFLIEEQLYSLNVNGALRSGLTIGSGRGTIFIKVPSTRRGFREVDTIWQYLDNRVLMAVR